MSSNAWSLNHCLVSVHKDPNSLLFQILFDKAVFRNDLNLQCDKLNIIIKDSYLFSQSSNNERPLPIHYHL